MRNSKIIIKDQTTQFIETITNRLNDFFNTISRQGYSFQCIHTPNQSEDKAIQLKKAYRIFKKFLIHQKLIDPQLGQKARQRFASRVWEQLNESQKLKYFTTKHFPPLHYLQKLVANVAAKRRPSNNQNRSKVQESSKLSKASQNVPLQGNQNIVSTENKKLDKKQQKQQGSVVVIE